MTSLKFNDKEKDKATLRGKHQTSFLKDIIIQAKERYISLKINKNIVKVPDKQTLLILH